MKIALVKNNNGIVVAEMELSKEGLIQFNESPDKTLSELNDVIKKQYGSNHHVSEIIDTESSNE